MLGAVQAADSFRQLAEAAKSGALPMTPEPEEELVNACAAVPTLNVCTGCYSQLVSWHVLGSRSYVPGLLIDSRVVALLELRSLRDLISGQVVDDH